MLWCIKGKVIKDLNADEIINREHRDKPAWVEFKFIFGKKVHKVRRTRKVGSTDLEYWIEDEPEKRKTIKMTQELIDEALDFSFNALVRAVICSAETEVPYLRLPESARKEAA